MPTKPFEDLLYRDLARVRAKEIIEVASPLLQEIVNFGTNAFMRCQAEAAEGEEDEHVPVLMLYLHILEMTDGIEELVSESCANPGMPLLRSSFEALLAMDFILQEEYQRRAFCWMVGYIHQRIASYELADPKTARGNEYLKAMYREKAEGFAVPSDEEIEKLAKQAREAIKRLEGALAKRQYEGIEAEYQAMRKKGNRAPRWYGLFGGPSNLSDLARCVNRSWAYQILYRKWSAIVHATDASRFLTKTSEGTPGFYPLRNPKELAQIAHLGAAFALNATRLLIRKFRPGENLAPWYKREVQEHFLWVGETRIKIEEA